MVKPLVECFSKDRTTKDGFRFQCKKCNSLYKKKYRSQPSVIKRMKEYAKTPARKEYWKKRRKTEAYKKYMREYKRVYGKTKKRREYINEWQRNRRKTNDKFRIDDNIGRGMRLSISDRQLHRKWEKIVGYNIAGLIIHIENQFEDWMNWNNYGRASINKKTWNIDHIKPKKEFKYESINSEEFKKCWALSNLRPLDAIENIKLTKEQKQWKRITKER